MKLCVAALLANGAVCLAVTLPLLVDVFLKVPFELFLAGGFSKSARESGGKTSCCVRNQKTRSLSLIDRVCGEITAG